jgi:hypothetical protein
MPGWRVSLASPRPSLCSAINLVLISFQGVIALLSQSAKCIALFLLQKTSIYI